MTRLHDGPTVARMAVRESRRAVYASQITRLSSADRHRIVQGCPVDEGGQAGGRNLGRKTIRVGSLARLRGDSDIRMRPRVVLVVDSTIEFAATQRGESWS